MKITSNKEYRQAMAPTSTQRQRNLTIAVIIALAFGAYFLRSYFELIVLSAIVAYSFNPVYKWLTKRTKQKNTAASLTLIATLLALVIPLTAVIIITVFQIQSALKSIPADPAAQLGNLGQTVLDWVNHVLSQLPGNHHITYDELANTLYSAIKNVAQSVLGIITSSISSIPVFITNVIIYFYVFISMLVYQDKLLDLIRKLNPLGDKVNAMYMSKVGAMTTAMVKGQFLIATLQGFIGAASLYIVGFHNLFFFMFLILSVLSLIPLGGGVLIIPLGIIMILLGDVWQGLFLLGVHFLITTNVDNVLRPRLVPHTARLNPALTILSVFAGVGMFGFLGIVLGPVIMVVITSTITVYLTDRRSSKEQTEAVATS